MAHYQRISADQALLDVDRGDAILVNAYDDDGQWQKTRVEGATSFMEFKQAGEPPRDKAIIFYCA
jgi:hypothetical protein